jgi:preprotein translocase subunit SecG
MGVLGILLLVIFIITSLLLIGLVLIQDEQGEGLGGIFGGGSAAPVGNRTGNILTKTTTILGAIFFLTSFGLAWLNRTPEAGNVEAAARQLEAEEGAIEWWRTEESVVPDAETEIEPPAEVQSVDDGSEALNPDEPSSDEESSPTDESAE